MGHKDNFYFENFISAADLAVKAANYLSWCLQNYDYANIDKMLETMHGFEHSADNVKHEMSAALAKAFVTPIDREDLALISQNIDDVTDTIEEVLQYIYIDRIKSISPYAVEFSEKIIECCELMKNMLTEFANFKKPEKLHSMIVALNNREEDCDKLYLKAAHGILDYSSDVLTVFAWREIYDKLEHCADACEHVGDCIETVVMKNT